MFVDVFMVAILLTVVSGLLMVLFEWIDVGTDGIIEKHLARARAKYDKSDD